MSKRRKKSAGLVSSQIQVGSSPGTIRDNPEGIPVEIRSIAFGPTALKEEVVTDPSKMKTLHAEQPVRWIRVIGTRGAETLEKLCAVLEIPTLVIEDALNQQQRPKVERFAGAIFLVLRTPGSPEPVPTRQISMWITKKRLVTFEPTELTMLDAVLERIRRGRPRLRTGGTDYLAYALTDTVVDGFFPILEAIGDRFEELETEIMNRPGEKTLGRMYELRRDVMALRRAAWPQRDLMSSLVRDESEVFGEKVRPFLQDCHDHAVVALDSTETLRDLGASLMELHLSSVGHRQNEVMKILTIFSAIFIPLSFVAGLYGMNFERDGSPYNMPELGWRYGYPAAILVMFSIAASLLVFFWRRGWIGRGKSNL